MRKILMATAASLALASAAQAGGMAEPVMEPEVVAKDTSSSSGGILIPLLLLVLIAAAVASGGNNGPIT